MQKVLKKFPVKFEELSIKRYELKYLLNICSNDIGNCLGLFGPESSESTDQFS